MVRVAVHLVVTPNSCVCRVNAPYQHAVTREILIPFSLLSVLKYEVFFVHLGVQAECLVRGVQRIQSVFIFLVDIVQSAEESQ